MKFADYDDLDTREKTLAHLYRFYRKSYLHNSRDCVTADRRQLHCCNCGLECCECQWYAVVLGGETGEIIERACKLCFCKDFIIISAQIKNPDTYYNLKIMHLLDALGGVNNEISNPWNRGKYRNTK